MTDSARFVEQQQPPGHTWHELRIMGKQAYLNCRAEQAEWLLTQSLHRAESFGEKDMRLIISLTELAGFYVVQERFDRAEPLLSRAISLGRFVLPRHDFQSLRRKFEAVRRVANGNGSLPSNIKWL